MQIEDVYTVQAQPLQAGFEKVADIGEDAAPIEPLQMNLRSNDRVGGSELLKKTAEVSFRFAVAVLCRCIEVINPCLQSVSYRSFLVGGIAANHQSAHRPAAKPQNREPQSASAEGTHFHRRSFQALSDSRVVQGTSGAPRGLGPAG